MISWVRQQNLVRGLRIANRFGLRSYAKQLKVSAKKFTAVLKGALVFAVVGG
jgi:hypothetical protein